VSGEHATTWRLHLRADPDHIFAPLATEEGRNRFWTEGSAEHDGVIQFRIPNGAGLASTVVESVSPTRYAIAYFGGRIVSFDLESDGQGGIDLTMTEEGVPPEEWAEQSAGWLSVLLNLKAAADFGVDLRNHDPARIWDQGYVDN
jgi:hypothetical protein